MYHFTQKNRQLTAATRQITNRGGVCFGHGAKQRPIEFGIYESWQYMQVQLCLGVCVVQRSAGRWCQYDTTARGVLMFVLILALLILHSSMQSPSMIVSGRPAMGIFFFFFFFYCLSFRAENYGYLLFISPSRRIHRNGSRRLSSSPFLCPLHYSGYSGYSG